jgi:radical SAM/Cys-rich protein
MSSLALRAHPLAHPAAQRHRLDGLDLPEDFAQALRRSGLAPLRPTGIDVFQMNLGALCNQTCRHCHVDAGPDRREIMSEAVIEACLAALEGSGIPTLDLTGGAPELHPHFETIVCRARALGRHVMDRCNLTVLQLPSHAGLPEFLAEQRVEIVASLPAWNPGQTDAQRGRGVFAASIEALRRLNAVGYARRPELQLVLVTNPVGAFLPGNQASLEREWKRELRRRWGVEFDRLYTLTNMPISRYLEYLIDAGQLEAYMTRLVNAFNPAAAAAVMCRSLVSVGWDGRLYDCDFNQMLAVGLEPPAPRTIFDFDLERLVGRRIRVGPHCFGCTAGAGSSCSGATAAG